MEPLSHAVAESVNTRQQGGIAATNLLELRITGMAMTKLGYWILSLIALIGGVGAAVFAPRWFGDHPAPVAKSVAPEQQISAPQTRPVKPDVKEAVPEFDVVRVEPTGEIVVAGRATPHALIVLLRGETQHGSASADAEGRFVMVPAALPPGNHELRLIATDRDGSKTSKQSVFVSVPQDRNGETIVALQAPDAPTINLKPVSQKQGERARVSIFAVDILSTGVMAASGSAEPGTELRFYLNDTFIANAKAASNGSWSLTVEKGLTPGLYRLRADEIGPDGKVVSRAEIQFDVPAIQASAPTNTVLASASPSNVVIPAVQTATVSRGDSLWRISQKIYGQGQRYSIIHGANAAQIRDPNLIYPGQVFVVPPKTP